TDHLVYTCGAEKKVEGKDAFIGNPETHQFSGGNGQFSEFAYEGDYCLKLDTVNKYGFSITLDDVQIGEYFEVSVQVKQKLKHGTLIAGVTGQTEYFLRTYDENFAEDENGWKKHSLSFSIDTEIDQLKVYTFSNGHECYFDNFEIRRYEQRPPIDVAADEKLNIYIPDSAFEQLSYYRSQALKDETIKKEYKEYVGAYILGGTDSLPIEMRLKGDWVDHLVSGKASYRIKTDKKGTFRNLRTFSIQHPKTRNYMHEWFLHRLFDMEGLLSTRYEFTAVDINEINHGIYALEEHFDKQLLESRDRREGPILKMDESGFWAVVADGRAVDQERSFPYYQASFISCFKKGRTMKSDALSQQFFNGATLLERYKNLDQNPAEIFDVEKLGKYYALLDLGNVHHALAWHNRRFYYNPVTARLEHVGFDMQPGVKPIGKPLAMEKMQHTESGMFREFLLDHYVLLDEGFRNAYLESYRRFSSKEYLDSVFDVLNEEIIANEELMKYEIENFQFNKDIYYEIADTNRGWYDEMVSSWDGFEQKYQGKSLDFQPHDFQPNQDQFHIKELAINCYRTKIDSANYLVEVDNFHLNDLELVGYSVKKNKDSIILFDEPVMMKAYWDGSQDYSVNLTLSEKPKKIFYRIDNDPMAMYSKNVFKWSKPKGLHPRNELERSFSTNSALYKLEEGKIVFKKGNYQLDRLVSIPKQYDVVITAGTQIDIVNNGGLIINGNLSMMGTADEKIVFTSSDSTSMGVTILGPDKVVIEHVEMYNQGALDYKGWTLTGALTVYESEVFIKHLLIDGNSCEDALNTIRCQVDVRHIAIKNTWGDGYDADFCSGYFAHSSFENTGNDCVDFSGSKVEIEDINITNSGDKGISAGERSNLTVKNITIDGCLTGLASKDGSHLTGDQINVKKATIGIAAFQKKPEYGPAHLELTNIEYGEIGNLGIIELGSTTNWDGKAYRGFVKFDIEAMYARFEK
ncbi:MAG: CotH kinase family protein, partial [Flavobacteriales bacterium]|nr:CotH kinase family protein [Flavobacteriales bacterium]